ncbi:MAG: response regulator transcription factor [Actinobacteria bacterium]|nr:response regulator transcription factor [Actinomycetota bacterium]
MGPERHTTAANRFSGVRLLGLGFWQAWWMIAMVTDVLLPETETFLFAGSLVLWVLTLTTLGYLAVVFASKWVSSFSSRMGSFVFAALAAGFGSLGMNVSILHIPGGFGFFIFLASTLAFSLGNALLLIMWGELWSALATGRVGRHLYFSYSFAFVLLFVVMALPPAVALLATALFPVASSCILYTCKDEPKRPPSVVPLPENAVPVVTVFIAVVLVSVVYGFSQGLTQTYSNDADPNVFMAKTMLLAGAAIWALTLSMFVRPNVVEPLVLYRPVIPAMVAGLLALVVLPASYSFLGAGLIILGIYCLDMLMMLVSTDIAFRSRIPVAFSFGLVILVARSGTFLGSIIAHEFSQSVAWSFAARDDLVLFAVLIVAFVGMLGFTQFDLQNLYRTRPIITADEVSLADKCRSIAKMCNLTSREQEVLVLLARGRSIPYICDELSIAQGTAKHHVGSIYRKTGVYDRQGLHDVIEHGAAGKGSWEK